MSVVPFIATPKEPVTRTLAVVSVDVEKSMLFVRFPEFRDDFRLLMRRLRFSWGYVGKHWFRRMTDLCGPLEDRAVETGCVLLAEGYCVGFSDKELFDQVVRGDFVPEKRRWVLSLSEGDFAGWFALTWGYDDDLYKAAKRLPGSRWHRPYVVVPSEHYDEVLDFAEMYAFEVSDGAKRLAEEAASVWQKALEVDVCVESLQQGRMVTRNGIPVLDIPDDVDIDNALKDDSEDFVA